jgi:hypothetical protein
MGPGKVKIVDKIRIPQYRQEIFESYRTISPFEDIHSYAQGMPFTLLERPR